MKKNLPLTLIFIVIFVDLLGFGVLIPILPIFTKNELHAPEFFVGIAIAIYSLVQFLFNPIFGSLSDRYGRKKIILFTLFLNAISYVIFAYSHNFAILLLSRVIGGIGGSSIGVAQAYIADVTTKEERSKGMGLVGVAFGVGFVFGPIIGGVLSKYGYHVTGFVSAGFSMTALIFCFFYLPESKTKISSAVGAVKRKIINPDAFRKVFMNPTVSIVIMLFFVITFSVANIFGTFALMGSNHYGFSNQQNGYIFGIVGLVSATIQGGVVARLSKYLSDVKLISIGSVFMMLGLGFLPFGWGADTASKFASVAGITVVLSIGTGMLTTVLLSLVSKVAPENEQGLVLGVNQSLSAFARMLGPLWGGFAFQYLGYQVPFLTGASLTFCIFIFSVMFLSKHIEGKKS